MPTIATPHGTLSGSETDGITAFKGVPYAAAPFGPNRFLPPQPVEPWQGIRDAHHFGHTAPRVAYPAPLDVLVPEAERTGEDCLNLNIWTPGLAARLPVMVWLHGGSFTNGSGAAPAYDGTRFARDGVVCVTVNYRLGADGFLYLGDGDTANLGLLDQLAALRWVQENISLFGGDPRKVTVFGESAGAMSIGALLAVPAADGLFQRAVLQSGAAHHAIPAATARRIGHHFTDMLGIPPTRHSLSGIPFDRLAEAAEKLRTAIAADPDPRRWNEVAHNLMPFEPVVDGDLLPRDPITSIADGSAATVDVLVGSNTDEFRLFLEPTGVIGFIDFATLDGAAAGYGLDPEEAVAVYRAQHPDGTPGDLLAALATDWYYRIPAIRLAEARMGRPGRTYLYEFAWRPSTFEGRLGACHTLEIPFVFDNLQVPALSPLLGPEPPQQLADEMHAAWIAFATHGDPGWAPYDIMNRTTMRFDTESRPLDDPDAEQRSLWDGRR
ncbi:carboxylesterase/lipase family protein [Streptomyces sp. LRE541]|uniref:carboxylesterase/lipase family protein n=1 Tax=Streptomyces sp. LRE541 TaxID=2931983 RepID=UPI00200DB640|nr:carboxylesterase/lipase family protein [Streptomyces sp. LRE541]UPZ26657.1 carboxylesterase/lipase family protein [Streptomyces sp. LRE541]